MVLQVQNPIRRTHTNRTELAITVFCNLYKTVVIIIEFCFVAIGKYLCNSLPATGETASYIIMNVMIVSTDAILNACEALIECVQSNAVAWIKLFQDAHEAAFSNTIKTTDDGINLYGIHLIIILPYLQCHFKVY